MFPNFTLYLPLIFISSGIIMFAATSSIEMPTSENDGGQNDGAVSNINSEYILYVFNAILIWFLFLLRRFSS